MSKETIHNAKLHSTKQSIGLLAEQRQTVKADKGHRRAAASAVARMERGYHLGGGALVSRDELHLRSCDDSEVLRQN